MNARRAIGFGAAVAALCALAWPGVAPGQDRPSRSADAQVRARVPPSIPEADRRRPNPVRPDKQSLDRGGQLYASQCAMCHGASGDGKGDLTLSLNFVAPDFTSRVYHESRTDGELFYVMTQGHGHMPGEGERLPEAWRWDLVNYVRSLRTEQE